MSALPEPTGAIVTAHAGGPAPHARGGEMLPAASAPGQVIRPRRLPVRVPGWLAAPAAPLARITAAAGGGFLAGVALMGLLRRRRGRRALAATRRRTRRGAGAQERGRGAELVQVVGSRSLLVDVHWLGKR